MQVELNRGLYLNERSLTTTAAFSPLRALLAEIFTRFIASLSDAAATRVAAE